MKSLLAKIFGLGLYVTMDSRDNSVTFSKILCDVLSIDTLAECKVFTFRIPEYNSFGFCINPDIEEPTQMSEIMFNGKYKTIGYECLNPTVNMIFYEYSLPYPAKIRLAVRRRRIGGRTVYEIKKPKYGLKDKLLHSIGITV